MGRRAEPRETHSAQSVYVDLAIDKNQLAGGRVRCSLRPGLLPSLRLVLCVGVRPAWPVAVRLTM